MKKLLLTLIVTMLTTLGAWAQGGTLKVSDLPVSGDFQGNSGTTYYFTASVDWPDGAGFNSSNHYVVYTATSSNTDVADNPTVNNGNIQVALKGEGKTTIRITAEAKNSWAENPVAPPTITNNVVEFVIDSKLPTGTINVSNVNLRLGADPAYPTTNFDWGGTSINGNIVFDDPVSSNPSAVKADINQNSVRITPLALADDVKVTVSATVYQYGTSTIIAKASGEFYVNVKGYSGKVSLTPEPSAEGLAFEKGETSETFTISALWENEEGDGSNLQGYSLNATSGEESVVRVNYNNGTFTLSALKKGTAQITVSSTYQGQTVEKKFNVNVTDKTLAESFTLASNAITIYQGQSDEITATYAPSTATFNTTITPSDQGLTAGVADGKLTINVPESATVQDYTVTVSPQEGSVDVNGDPVPSQTVTVIVKDKTHASSIDAPETVSVAYGNGTANYAKDFTISFEPATAQIAIDNENSNIPSGVTCSLSADYKTLTVNANDATEASTGKIVLKSGDLTKDISLNVVAPKHVTGVTLKEGETILGETKTIDKDATFTITAEVAPEDVADATLTWAVTPAEARNTIISFDETTGEVKGLKAGEATITATSKSIAGQPAQTASVKVIVEETLTANVEGFPTAAIKIGDNVTPNVTATNTGISTADYTVSYSVDPSDVLSYDEATKKFTALKAGTATVTINVTHNGDNHYKDAAPIQKVVEVKKNEYTLAISTDTKLFKTGDSGNAQISVDEIKFNGNVITSGDYDIRYEVKPAYTGVSVDEEIGAVTVSSSAAKGQATIVATLTPSDVDNNTTATASVTLTIADVIAGGATIKKDGDFYVINVPYPGALAAELNKATDSGIEDAVSAKEALLSAAKVKFTGDINNEDMVAFSGIVGTNSSYLHKAINADDQQIDNLNVLKTLDMSGAKLVENATATSGSHSFTPDYWQYRLYSVTDFTIPTPASDAIVLPTYFGQWCPNMASLTIPDGWKSIGKGAFQDNTKLRTLDMSGCETLTEIKESAFENCRVAPGDGLRDIKFAPNLAIIREKAFRYHEANVLMFPPLIEEIYAGAFENYGGSNSLTDVFFTGVAVTPHYVATTAFSASTQMCNNSVADNATLPNGDPSISNGTITRNSYHNGGFLGCILHFPAEADRWRYTDPDRVYDDGGRSEYTGGVEGTWNSKAMFDYNPYGWDSEFLEEVKAEIPNMKDPFTGTVEQQANILYGITTTRWDEQLSDGVYINGGYPDRTFGSNKLWPSQQQMQNGYTISRAGYLWKGDAMTTRELDPENNVDLRGLYQFIVAFTDAPDNPEKWKFKNYSMDLWYTFCVPFNMSVTEIKSVFGENTQVCRFSSVTREVSEDATSRIVLEFRKSVMVPNGYSSTERIKVSTVLGSDGKAVDTFADEATTGIVHHVPYMIKPGGDVTISDPADPGYIQPEFKEDGSRVLPNFKRVGGAMVLDVIKIDDIYDYSFEGNFEPMPLPNHIYFLANAGGGVHKFFFSHDAEGTLNPYTASVRVRKAHTAEGKGDDDYNDFFSKVGTSTALTPASQAKFINSFFGDEEDPTAIEEVRIVCGDDKLENDDRIFNLRGQQVNGYNLPAGIYVKNGKKFVVK